MSRPSSTFGDLDEQIWLTVSSIPPGKIATYGDVAERAGLPGGARRVGLALKRLSQGTKVPWHRVLNASGRIALPTGSSAATEQRERLAVEGVHIGAGGKRVLDKYRW